MVDMMVSSPGCRHLWRVVLVLCLTWAMAAHEVSPQRAPMPDVMRDDVEAMMWINDPAWLFGQLDALVGVAGHPAQRLRGLLRESLLLSASLDGIDLERPAFLAWRRGPAPLVAVIPVKDRRAFLRDFGRVLLIDRQMIRINELSGTIVYSQNTMDGLWEYRLLLRNDYAYLARSADECRALAEMGLASGDETLPIALWTDGDYLLRVFQDQVNQACRVVAGGWIQDCVVFSRMVADLRERSEHIAGIDLRIVREGEDRVMPRLTLRPRPDSPLALWVARQRSRSSRLLGAVARDGDLVQVHGALQWQGEIEDFGRRFAARLRDHDAVTIDSERASALRGFFNLLDRRAAFAMAWHPPHHGSQGSGPTLRAVAEQQLATEYLRGQRAMDQVLNAVDGRPVGALDLLAGHVSYRYPLADDRGHVVKVGLPRHLIEVVASHAAAAEVEARTMMTILEEEHAPRGAAAIVAARIFVGRILAQRSGSAQAAAPGRDLALDVALVPAAGQQLALETRWSMATLLETLRDSSLGTSRSGD